MNETIRAMPVPVTGEHLHRVRPVHAVVTAQVGREGWLAVGGGRDRPQTAGLTQNMRRQEAADLRMTGEPDRHRGFDIPKASPESVARAIFDGVENGEEDIFPDPMSQSIAEGWRGGVAKTLERQYAAIATQFAAVA